jgi:hypothetical protein
VELTNLRSFVGRLRHRASHLCGDEAVGAPGTFGKRPRYGGSPGSGRVASVLLLLLLGLLSVDTAAAQPLPPIRPGDTITVVVPIAAHGREAGTLRWMLQAAPGATVLGPHSGTLPWSRGSVPTVGIPLRVVVPPGQPAGVMRVGRLAAQWADGARDSARVQLTVQPAASRSSGGPSRGAPPTWPPAAPLPEVLDPVPPLPRVHLAASPAVTAPPPPPVLALARRSPGDRHHQERVEGQEWVSIQIGGLTREVEVELYGTTRTVSPGGVVMVRYTVYNWEDTDERVRLRLHLPPGWTLLDAGVEDREFLITAEDYELEGELRVVVPQDARPGERHRIRMLAEVIGEPGGAAVYSYVQIVRKGGLKPGAVGLSGTTSLQASHLGAAGLESARYGGVAELSGRLSHHTTLSLEYRQGARESTLTNYRIAQEETRCSGSVRRPSWNLQFGNQISSSGSVLTGPYVRGQGASLRRTQGLLVSELTLAQPTSYTSEPGGHLLRGSFGLSGKHGRLAAAFSDFGRPVGGYTTAPRYPEEIDPDSLERLEHERRATEQAPSNRVQGAGVEMELRAASVHRLSVRGGWLRLANARGESIQEPSAEAQYGFQHRRATLNGRWRQMPQSLQGVHLPGDESSVDASVKVIGEWRLAGRAYRSRTETLGNAFHSEGEGASAGIRWFRQRWRLDLRGNVREWSYGQQPTMARTASLSFGVPLGPLGFNGHLERGEQQRDTLRSPAASYRGDLRWSGRGGSLSWSASYHETLSARPRLRTDLLGSLKLGEWEMAGGAWATRGLQMGGEPGFWSQLGVPVGHDLLLNLGVEHAPPAWGAAPQWLGTLGVRTRVTLPIPFLRDGTVARPAAAAAPHLATGESSR